MEFLNRFKEKERLEKALESEKAKLVIIYGRRRCGKSTLIKNTLTQKDVYFMAQNADESIQRIQLASTIGEKISGFESVVYPDWNSLFTNLNNVIKEPFTLCIDEFPYLVKSATGLPSTIQQMIDTTIKRKFHLVLCGSSQQMMKGLVIDSASP
ncbi:MAG: ATP-binding protein, partial [Bacteroidetes bacterium]|nr:ATP-binding protein [Bacteroidota bacterium]